MAFPAAIKWRQSTLPYVRRRSLSFDSIFIWCAKIHEVAISNGSSALTGQVFLLFVLCLLLTNSKQKLRHLCTKVSCVQSTAIAPPYSSNISGACVCERLRRICPLLFQCLHPCDIPPQMSAKYTLHSNSKSLLPVFLSALPLHELDLSHEHVSRSNNEEHFCESNTSTMQNWRTFSKRSFSSRCILRCSPILALCMACSRRFLRNSAFFSSCIIFFLSSLRGGPCRKLTKSFLPSHVSFSLRRTWSALKYMKT